MTTPTVEELRGAMAEFFEAAKSLKEVNWPKLEADAAAKMAELVSTEIQAKLDAMPVRRTPGNAIALDKGLGELKGNRYHRVVKDIAEQGYFKHGSKQIRQQDLGLVEKLLKAANRNEPNKYPGPSADLTAAIKLMNTDNTGFGAELVEEATAGFMWEDMVQASRVVANLPMIDPMPADPFPIPNGIGDITWRGATSGQPTTSQDVATGENELRTKEIIAEVQWPYNLEEDSMIAMMPTIRSKIVRSGGELVDDFALNADKTITSTGNINCDDATPSADAFYIAVGDDGIRHQWLVDNATTQNIDAGGDALSDADMIAMFAAMGKYAQDLGNLRMFTDIVTLLKSLRGLTSVFTVDKYGPLAVVLTGELGRYMDIPIIPSASHRRCAADGKVNSGSGNTLGSITTLHRDFWYAGFKRGLTIEADRDIRSRRYILVASLREAIVAHGTRASNIHTAGIRNIL